MVCRIKVIPVFPDLLMTFPRLAAGRIQIVFAADAIFLYRLPAFLHLAVGVQIVDISLQLQEALEDGTVLFEIELVFPYRQPSPVLGPQQPVAIKVIALPADGLPVFKNRSSVIDKGAGCFGLRDLNGHPIIHRLPCVPFCSRFQVKEPPHIVKPLPAILENSAVVEIIDSTLDLLLPFQHLPQGGEPFIKIVGGLADGNKSGLQRAFPVKIIPLAFYGLPAL